MNILIIGGSGNLGSNIFTKLLNYKKIKNIFIVDFKRNKIPKKNFFQIDLSKKKINIKERLLLKNLKIDLALILAFDINFKKAKKNYIIYGKNIINNSLSLCKLCNIKRVVYFSSFAVYGNKRKLISEKTTPKPINVYGKLKLYCEKKLKIFCKEHSIKYIILRISQVYGYKILSSIIGKFHQLKIDKQRAVLINNGQQFRDYVYVDDFIKLIKKIVNYNFKKNYIFNMCSGKKTKTLTIIKLLKLKYQNLHKNNEIKSLLGDNSYIKKELKWYPSVSIKNGINKILNNEKNS